jgi:CDP-diacylglycerol--serine O-phosphatidyltransferase
MENTTPTVRCVVPCSITLLNALCGLGAIMFALNGILSLAVYCVIAAALCDFFDGFFARILNATSGFGSELDSLADAISFCVAPAIVVYGALNGQLPWASPLILGLYVCAGLCRLARFNTCSPSPATFTGLPTTLAALALVQILSYTPPAYGMITLCCVGVLAGLMVSTVPFPKIRISNHLRTRQVARYTACALIIALVTHSQVPSIFIATLCWALYSTIMQNLTRRHNSLRWRRLRRIF